jgi:hypothetical protein
MCRTRPRPTYIGSAGPHVRAQKVSRFRCATAKRWRSCATSKNSFVCQSQSAIDVPITDSQSIGPPGSFRAQHLSMLVNDTRATVVRYKRKIAIIHPSDPSPGVSVQLPSYTTEGRSATLLEARSVGQANQKEGNVANDNDESIDRKSGGTMRIFVFKSEANPELSVVIWPALNCRPNSSRGVQWAPSPQIRTCRTQ